MENWDSKSETRDLRVANIQIDSIKFINSLTLLESDPCLLMVVVYMYMYMYVRGAIDVLHLFALPMLVSQSCGVIE